jgi:hypothetical protein
MGYALVVSNLGTIYRERNELLVVMFVFVGVAVDGLMKLISGYRSRMLLLRTLR